MEGLLKAWAGAEVVRWLYYRSQAASHDEMPFVGAPQAPNEKTFYGIDRAFQWFGGLAHRSADILDSRSSNARNQRFGAPENRFPPKLE